MNILGRLLFSFALMALFGCTNGAPLQNSPSSASNNINSAKSGTDSSGGGDALPVQAKSDPLVVTSVLNNLNEYTFDQWRFVNLLIPFIQDGELKAVVSDLSASRGPYQTVTIKDIWVNGVFKKMVIQNAACTYQQGQLADASVSRFDLLGTVCISTGRLSVLPPELLEKQIAALLTHEISHLLGYGESAAVKVQKFSLEYIEGYEPTLPRSAYSKAQRLFHIERDLEDVAKELEEVRDDLLSGRDRTYKLGEALFDLKEQELNNFSLRYKSVNVQLSDLINRDLSTFDSELSSFFAKKQVDAATAKDVDQLIVDWKNFCAKTHSILRI